MYDAYGEEIRFQFMYYFHARNFKMKVLFIAYIITNMIFSVNERNGVTEQHIRYKATLRIRVFEMHINTPAPLI